MQKRHFKYTVKFTILFQVPYRIFYSDSHSLKTFQKYIKTPEMHRIRRIISGVSFFLLLAVLLVVFIQQLEQIPYPWTGKENLPAQRHRKILRGLLQPQRDNLFSRIHEKQCRDKAHHRAHQADDHRGDRNRDKCRAILWCHNAKCKLRRKLFYHKIFQDTGDWPHDRNLMEGD